VEILLHVTSSHLILAGPREPANRQAAWLMAWYLFRFAPVVGETVTEGCGVARCEDGNGRQKRMVMAKAGQERTANAYRGSSKTILYVSGSPGARYLPTCTL
jgi:hypothetical protein